MPQQEQNYVKFNLLQIISKHAGSTVGGTKVNYKSWKVAAIMPIASDEADDDVVFMTRHGWLKRMHVSELLQARNGFRVMKFRVSSPELRLSALQDQFFNAMQMSLISTMDLLIVCNCSQAR